MQSCSPLTIVLRIVRGGPTKTFTTTTPLTRHDLHTYIHYIYIYICFSHTNSQYFIGKQNTHIQGLDCKLLATRSSWNQHGRKLYGHGHGWCKLQLLPPNSSILAMVEMRTNMTFGAISLPKHIRMKHLSDTNGS